MLSLIITAAPGNFKESTAAEAAKDIVLDKCTTGNPIGGYDTEGNLIYGGDPAVLVDGEQFTCTRGMMHPKAVQHMRFLNGSAIQQRTL